MTLLLHLFFSGLSLLGLIFSFSSLESYRASRALTSDEQEVYESLYLVRPELMGLVSFGYGSPFGNYLWLTTINYFGKQYRGERSYTWLATRCRGVIALNPRFPEPYEFCASMLAWEADQPEEAIEILDSAVRAREHDWYVWYLRGFFRLHFLDDATGATADFKQSALLPGAHYVVKQLAARGLVSYDAGVAVEFLRYALELAQDSNEKVALEARLREALHAHNIERLARFVQQMSARRSLQGVTIAELIAEHGGELPLYDPWGARYELLEDGTVSSGREVLASFHRREPRRGLGD